MGKSVPNAFTTTSSHSCGFTLIELLVVIAIMAVIGVFTLANYKSFGEDQNLKNAVLDIQSMLRTAQTNATANVKCNTGYSVTWQVEFTSASTLNLRCSASLNSQRTLQLAANITQSVSGSGGSNCPAAPPFTSPYPTISFDPLTGKVSFGDSRCTSLTITLQNSKTSSTKSFIVQGGTPTTSPTATLTPSSTPTPTSSPGATPTPTPTPPPGTPTWFGCFGGSYCPGEITCVDFCLTLSKTANGSCSSPPGDVSDRTDLCIAHYGDSACSNFSSGGNVCTGFPCYSYVKCCCQ